MKTVCLLLLLFLVQSGSAETSVPYTPDSLKKGDRVAIESVHYYPYIAPGLREELPWRVENIRRVIFQATVADVNADALTIDYTLKNLYDCRNDNAKPGFYYFDSRYRQDFALEGSVPDKPVLRVTYDRKSRNALTVDNANTSFSYSKVYVPFGVRQEGLSAYPETIVRDSVNLSELLIPAAKGLLTGWKNDGTIQPAPEARVIEASFALPPNTEFTCSFFNLETGKNATVHKKLFIPYPTEYEVGKYTTMLLTPGDCITQDQKAFEEAHVTRFLGRGSEQNNLRYGLPQFGNLFEFDLSSPEQFKEAFQQRETLFRTALKEDSGKMDPYWRRTFEINEQYLQAAFVLRQYMQAANKDIWLKSGLPDWQAPCFASLNPLIDYAYELKNMGAAHYGYFLYSYGIYKKQELKADNLSLNKQKKLTPQEDYGLNKQIFSGYPKYLVSAVNLMELTGEKMFYELEDDYNDFIVSCPDTTLTNRLRNLYDKLAPFESGKNIRESGLMIADSLPLVKGSDRKYILLFLSTGNGLSIPNLQNALDLQQLLKKEGLASTVKLEMYARFSPQNTERVKPYKAIPEEQKRYLNYKLGTGPLTVLMREDGTILYRRFGDLNIKPILGLVQKDLEDDSSGDFMKGFKEGVLGSLLVCVLIGIVYYMRTKNKQKREQRRRHISELELRAIRSQMNPHFIFNALSSIQNLINRSANEEANEYLIDFSRLLRKVLATSEKKLVTLSDEIEQLQLYLKLEQLRVPFSYSLTVGSNIEPDVVEIPGMLIQPFVENAVKHGIAPQGKGEITIRLSLQNQLLVIDITDDGPGFDAKADEGFGIRAITSQFEILKTLYNTEIGITIENRQEKESVSGCHVRLSIPL